MSKQSKTFESIVRKEQIVMERRAFDRSNSNIIMRFYCIDNDYVGTIINLSKNGMCINIGDNFLPCGAKVGLFVPLVKKVVKLSAKICRIVKYNDLNYIIGVEIIKPPHDYMDFADRFKDIYTT